MALGQRVRGKYDGDQCPRCGKTLRYRSSGRCVKCCSVSGAHWRSIPGNRERSIANSKRWRDAPENREHIKRMSREKYAANREREKVKNHEWYICKNCHGELHEGIIKLPRRGNG